MVLEDSEFSPAVAQDARRSAVQPCHQSCQRRREIAWISSNKFVGADRGGFGTFRVVAQSEAGYAKHGRFFGNAARIGNRNVSMSLGHLPLAFSVELRLSES